MHNIKEIRKNYQNFEQRLKIRNVNININDLKKLDEKNRNLIQQKETLEKPSDHTPIEITLT